MDNNIEQQYNFQLVKQYMGYDSCKECGFFHTKNGKVLCGNMTPSPDNCIAIKEFGCKPSGE